MSLEDEITVWTLGGLLTLLCMWQLNNLGANIIWGGGGGLNWAPIFFILMWGVTVFLVFL